MEEYLQNMKNLRSQMNDFENEAANFSVEEEKLKTEIQSIESDIRLAQSETKRLRQEADEMVTSKGQICCLILEKQKKIAILEAESSSLSQTHELLQQEKVTLSSKIKDKRAFYANIMVEMSAKLKEQQEWFNSHLSSKEVEGMIDGEAGNPDVMAHETNGKYKDLLARLELAKTRLEETIDEKSKQEVENSKIKQIIEQLKHRLVDFPPALQAMDTKALQEECKALLVDKAGEMEYLQSLKERIEQVKGISQPVRCRCGHEYIVSVS